MDSTDLTTAIIQLTTYAELGEAWLADPLTALLAALSRAVPSFAGLHLTMSEHGHDVTLAAFVDDATLAAVRTTLSVPLRALAPTLDQTSRLVLYAETPGTLTDLGADLAYALRLPLHTSAPSTPDTHPTGGQPDQPTPALSLDIRGRSRNDESVRLDHDPLPRSTTSTMTGLDGRAWINRAVGFLLDRGTAPADVHQELQRQAADAGVPVARQARTILGLP